MAVRRRERRTERSKIDATPPWETRRRDEPGSTSGPYDERDAPEDELTRVDLGALLVPVGMGLDVRIDMNEGQQVVAATLTNPDGSVQLGVFAAPRNEGIWDDVRGELAESVRGQRGAGLTEADGPWGAELVGQLPGEAGPLPVRFVGVDGPRWFLRAMFVGPVATDAARADVFEQTLAPGRRRAGQRPAAGARPAAAAAAQGGRRGGTRAAGGRLSAR